MLSKLFNKQSSSISNKLIKYFPAPVLKRHSISLLNKSEKTPSNQVKIQSDTPTNADVRKQLESIRNISFLTGVATGSIGTAVGITINDMFEPYRNKR